VKGKAVEYQGFSVLQNTALLITVAGVMFRVRALAQPRSVEPEVTEIRLARVALKMGGQLPSKGEAQNIHGFRFVSINNFHYGW
jgi:hypothetical protein